MNFASIMIIGTHHNLTTLAFALSHFRSTFFFFFIPFSNSYGNPFFSASKRCSTDQTAKATLNTSAHQVNLSITEVATLAFASFLVSGRSFYSVVFNALSRFTSNMYLFCNTVFRARAAFINICFSECMCVRNQKSR